MGKNENLSSPIAHGYGWGYVNSSSYSVSRFMWHLSHFYVPFMVKLF